MIIGDIGAKLVKISEFYYESSRHNDKKGNFL